MNRRFVEKLGDRHFAAQRALDAYFNSRMGETEAAMRVALSALIEEHVCVRVYLPDEVELLEARASNVIRLPRTKESAAQVTALLAPSTEKPAS